MTNTTLYLCCVDDESSIVLHFKLFITEVVHFAMVWTINRLVKFWWRRIRSLAHFFIFQMFSMILITRQIIKILFHFVNFIASFFYTSQSLRWYLYPWNSQHFLMFPPNCCSKVSRGNCWWWQAQVSSIEE